MSPMTQEAGEIDGPSAALTQAALCRGRSAGGGVARPAAGTCQRWLAAAEAESAALTGQPSLTQSPIGQLSQAISVTHSASGALEGGGKKELQRALFQSPVRPLFFSHQCGILCLFLSFGIKSLLPSLAPLLSSQQCQQCSRRASGCMCGCLAL